MREAASQGSLRDASAGMALGVQRAGHEENQFCGVGVRGCGQFSDVPARAMQPEWGRVSRSATRAFES